MKPETDDWIAKAQPTDELCRLYHGVDCPETAIYADDIWFKRNPPTKHANPVCDDCVTLRLEMGDLVEVDGHFL